MYVRNIIPSHEYDYHLTIFKVLLQILGVPYEFGALLETVNRRCQIGEWELSVCHVWENAELTLRFPEIFQIFYGKSEFSGQNICSPTAGHSRNFIG